MISARRQLRLLVVVDGYPGQGSEAINPFIHAQLRALCDQGAEVIVVSPVPFVPQFAKGRYPASKMAALEVVDGITVHRPRFPRPPGVWFRAHSGAVAARFAWPVIARIVANWKPDLIVAHMCLPSGEIARRWARWLMIPYLATVHGLDITLYPKQSTKIMKRTRSALDAASTVVCNSEYLREETLKIEPDRSKIVLNYIGCDISRFCFDLDARVRIRAQLGLNDGAFLVGYIGRLEAEKGVFDLADACRDFARSGSPAQFVFVGDGRAAVELRSRLDISGDVRAKVFPSVPPSSVIGWMSALDALVLPSHEEAFGLVLIEAQATGLPVIATRTGGIPEAVAPDAGNRLVPLGDPEALTQAIQMTIREAGSRQAEDANKRRRFVAEGFDAARHARELFAIYTRTVESFRAKAGAS